MFDLQVLEFKQRIIEEINNSQIPLTVLNYVFKDINDMLKTALEEQIKQDRQTKEQQIDMSFVDIGE